MQIIPRYVLVQHFSQHYACPDGKGRNTTQPENDADFSLTFSMFSIKHASEFQKISAEYIFHSLEHFISLTRHNQ